MFSVDYLEAKFVRLIGLSTKGVMEQAEYIIARAALLMEYVATPTDASERPAPLEASGLLLLRKYLRLV